MFSRFITLSVSIFAAVVIAGCSSDPAESSTPDAGIDASTSDADASTSDADASTSDADASTADADASDGDVIITPEELTCLELADCFYACAGDTECITGCHDEASETASADFTAVMACLAEAQLPCTIDESVLDFRCAYEECAEHIGSCAASEPEDLEDELNCIELGMCIAQCEGEGCEDACRAQASEHAIVLLDAMIDCSIDPENVSACEAEADPGACLYERCKSYADACNEHGGESEGYSCEQILSCMDDECSNMVCSFSCLEKGSEDGKADVLIAFDGLKQCHQDGVEACYDPEGTSWDCIHEQWAECATVCP
jgi:outer membrane murein-binding lipoprotein Lpp